MARQTKRDKMFYEDIWETVNKENKLLLKEFLEYLHSTDRSDDTVYQYEKDLMGFFCFFHDNCGNKEFYDLKKRGIIKYQNWLLNDLGKSPNRIRRLKGSLSSLSNYIENVLDEEYPKFRNIVNKISPPAKVDVRKKTVLSEEQIKKVCDTFVENSNYQEACFVAVLASSGMRKSESLRIMADWFVDDNIIYESMYKTPVDIKTKGRGKKGKLLTKYFLISLLQPYLDLWLEERGRLNINCDELFVRKVKGEYIPAIISTANSWAERSGKLIDEDIYIHALRHFLDTYMHKHNLPSHIIQSFFGWSSAEMVQLYNDTEAEEEFGKFFGDEGIKQVKEKGLGEI